MSELSTDDEISTTAALLDVGAPRRLNKAPTYGSFKTMNLSPMLLKGITRKGYRNPTPIQRKLIPAILCGRDTVAMARTGSGKTAAFLIPMFVGLSQRNPQLPIRAIILSPTRELAIQTARFVREIGRFLSLTSVLIVGGERIEDQFTLIHSKPDIVVATPGRLMHLLVEMQMSRLANASFIVLDEADRLFELGFANQVSEILSRLPRTRQISLVSATLPQQLAEFASASLHHPIMIRLDAETRLSQQLQLEFIQCQTALKFPTLLHILSNIFSNDDTRKEQLKNVIIFAATRYHVDLLHYLISVNSDYKSSYVYSNLDAVERKTQLNRFVTKQSNILIVTDLAARGIDIPHLDVAINYHFVSNPKLFVHRVGRVARAGKTGIAYSIMSNEEMPYAMDLLIYLNKEKELIDTIRSAPQEVADVYGELDRMKLSDEVIAKLCKSGDNAYDKYRQSRPAATNDGFLLFKEHEAAIRSRLHPIFDDLLKTAAAGVGSRLTTTGGTINEAICEAKKFVDAVKCYKSRSTIFEINSGKTQSKQAVIAKRTRTTNEEKIERKKSRLNESSHDKSKASTSLKSVPLEKMPFSQTPRKREKIVQDLEYFIPYVSCQQVADSMLSSHTVDLVGDEEQSLRKQQNQRWNRKKKRFESAAAADDESSKPGGGKIKTESGRLIPKSFKKGLYDAWKKSHSGLLEANDDGEVNEGGRKVDYRGRKHRGNQRKTPGSKGGLAKTSGQASDSTLKSSARIAKDRIEKRTKQWRNTAKGRAKRKPSLMKS